MRNHLVPNTVGPSGAMLVQGSQENPRTLWDLLWAASVPHEQLAAFWKACAYKDQQRCPARGTTSRGGAAGPTPTSPSQHPCICGAASCPPQREQMPWETTKRLGICYAVCYVHLLDDSSGLEAVIAQSGQLGPSSIRATGAPGLVPCPA